jgi:hypothetical protein
MSASQSAADIEHVVGTPMSIDISSLSKALTGHLETHFMQEAHPMPFISSSGLPVCNRASIAIASLMHTFR